MKIEGYVIVHPLSPWDRPYRDVIIGDMAYHSFGKTPAEAWRRHIGPMTSEEVNDRSIFGRKVQFWFNRGYRLKKATMEIYYDNTAAYEEHDQRGTGRKD